MDKLVTITGMTCAGKTELERDMMNHESGLFSKVISTTTRPPRVNEKDGLDYYFVTPEEFRNRELVEHVSFDGYVYGVERKELERHMDAGKIPVIVCEPNGARQFAEYADRNGVIHLAVMLLPKLNEVLPRFLKRDVLGPVAHSKDDNQKILVRASNRFQVLVDEERYWSEDLLKDAVVPPRLVVSYGLYDRDNRETNIISDVLTYLELPNI